MYKVATISLFIVFTSSLFCFGKCDEILGCGGFVKSDVAIDFSQIEIQLYTSEGLLKYQTECAPNNGYFMVPYVEKGNFVLKIDPPKGWLFDPMSVELNVDGVNDDCSKGKDINFVFKGFIVSGQISSIGSVGVGPLGVNVELRSTSNNLPPQSTQSIENGQFVFKGVLPGNYQVRVSHKSYNFDKSTTTVSVTTGNTKCDGDLVVSGYNLAGKVTVQSHAVSGVQLMLFTKQKLPKEVEGCDPKKPAGANDIQCPGFPLFICAATSNGNYMFQSLPPAEYAIVPYHKGKRTQYEMEPKILTVTVVNGHVITGTNFKVTGYSVQGRILNNEKGHPVKGAQVFVKETYQDSTDEQGYYTIKHRYGEGSSTDTGTVLDVTVKKEDMEFSRQKIKISPDTSLLPDIVAHSFSLCGHVDIYDGPAGYDATLLSVEIVSKGKNAHPQRSHLDKNGLFCFMKPTGEYNLKIIVPKSLEDKGLAVIPSAVKTKIFSAPVKNVAFTQQRADGTVLVTCIDTCVNVAVELTSVASGKKQKYLISEKANRTKVIFKNLLPGEYTVHVSHEDWCWLNDSIDVRVPRDEQKSPIELAHVKQSGFLLVCSISHDVEMVIHHEGEEVNTFSLKKGRNRLCLSRLGKYTLEPRSCHRFDIQPPIIYDTANPKPVTLHAVAHRAIIVLETTKAFFESDVKEDKIPVQLRSSRGKVTKDYFAIEEIDSRKKMEKVIFRLIYWASDGEKLEVIPSSSVLLFDPPTLNVAMKAGECVEELARFKGIVGIFITGHVTPALPNVNIAIATAKDELITLKTNVNGHYRVGPLHPSGTYDISASLEDYAMTPIEGKKGCFAAKKLSKLIFRVTMENIQSPLPGVLISISGGNYRSNNLTGSDGTLTLIKLEPGSYYFKAIMKEFQFDPPSKVIEIVEGAKTEINIIGKRVAFSAYGHVASLNGQPETGVIVRALSRPDGEQCRGLGEEAVTENDGSFRIKGLHPGCSYDFAVRDKEEKFNKVAPERLTIAVSNDDITNVRFIAFRPLSGFELSGYVVTPVEFLPYIKIALYRAGESASSAPVHTVSLTKETPFFYLPSLARDGKEYIARLESSLSSTLYDYTAPAAGFFAVGPHKHINLRFDPQRKQVEAETSGTSALALPLAILIGLLSYYHVAVLSYLKQAFRSMNKKPGISDATKTGRKSRK